MAQENKPVPPFVPVLGPVRSSTPAGRILNDEDGDDDGKAMRTEAAIECKQELLQMNLVICTRREPEQLPFLTEIAELGAGIEFGSYAMIGIRSQRDWETRFAMRKAIRSSLSSLPIRVPGLQRTGASSY
jgi:hypothetical protein